MNISEISKNVYKVTADDQTTCYFRWIVGLESLVIARELSNEFKWMCYWECKAYLKQLRITN